MHLPWMMSDLHPHALSLSEDALDDPDFADKLTSDLAVMSPPDIIHRFRVVARAGQSAQTLKQHGFAVTRLTRLIDLKFDVLDHPALGEDLPPHLAPHWFMPTERGPWDQWLDAHWRQYVARHTTNPPQRPVGGVRQVFMGDDLIEGFALRDGPQGRVRAFASLRRGQELGWIGGADHLPQTLAACLRRAATLGWVKLSVEVDDDDHALWGLIDGLGVAPSQEFVTWQLERAPSLAGSRPHPHRPQ